ncbi:MAG: hypothetical protein R3F11_11020 [Verrucomicrobiales bacterium]
MWVRRAAQLDFRIDRAQAEKLRKPEPVLGDEMAKLLGEREEPGMGEPDRPLPVGGQPSPQAHDPSRAAGVDLTAVGSDDDLAEAGVEFLKQRAKLPGIRRLVGDEPERLPLRLGCHHARQAAHSPQSPS